MLRKWRSRASLVFSLALTLAVVVVASFPGSAVADTYNSGDKVKTTGDNTLIWTGQGVTAGQLDTSQCDANNNPYLLWIFTTGNVNLTAAPVLHLGGTGSGTTTGEAPGQGQGGSYHFTTGFFTLAGLTANVTFNIADFGNGRTESQNMELTISHGCAGPPPVTKKDVTVSTTVFNAGTNQPLGEDLKLAAPGAAYDKATVTPLTTGPALGGTVTYTFFTNGACTGGGTAAGSGTQSTTEPNLAAGSYSFKAHYSGDDNYNSKDSACEPFTVVAVEKVDPSVTTTVFDTFTDEALVGDKLAAGRSVYDTSVVAGVTGRAAPTGTISYRFYNEASCETDGVEMGTGLALGSHSTVKGPLQAGSYAFKAFYSGDGNYNSKESGCEPFTVVSGPYDPSTRITTTIFNAATNAALTGNLPVNGKVYDTSVVAHVGGLTPTGTISYRFWTNGTCTDPGTSAGAVLAVGSKSTTQGPLAAGQYSFKAYFTSTDPGFSDSQSTCEVLTVSGGTGQVLAATGANPLGLVPGLALLVFGMLAIGGALVYRRSEA